MMSPYSAEKAGAVLEGAGGTASTGSSRKQHERNLHTAMGVMSRACPCSSDKCTRPRDGHAAGPSGEAMMMQ